MAMMQPESSAAKRPRLSLSSSGKLCVVFHGGLENSTMKPEKNEFHFYIVDGRECDGGLSPGGVEYPYLKPSIRFIGSKSDSPSVAFCALNSTLYMFEGDDLLEPRGVGVKTFDQTYAGKFVMTSEILDGHGPEYKLERKDLVSIKPMHQRKNLPIALPTPDGKSILVFSSDFFFIYPGCYDSSFELYNIAEDSWEAVPPLPSERHYPSHSSYKTVEAYGFVSDSLSLFKCASRFLIQLNGGLVFVLDLKTLEWERDIIESPFPWCEGYFFGFDELYFTPLGAYRVGEYGMGLFGFKPPLPAFPDNYDDDDPYGDKRFYMTLSPCIALLGGDEYEYDKNGAFDIGVVRAQRPSEAPDSHSLHVMLNICCIDLVQFKKDLQRFQTYIGEHMGQVIPRELDPSLKTTCSKTLKFLVDVDFSSYVYGVMNVFSI